MGDYDWIGAVAKGAGDVFGGIEGNRQMQSAMDEMLANWRQRMADYDALGGAGYQDIVAQQLGPSALEGLQYDPAARQAELEAMGALADMAENGGLTLGDQKAINDVNARLSQSDTARRKGLANEFAARGQLGSGAQLAMALAGQQDAAMNANQRAESVAAQAQQRAMQAILERGRMGASMGDRDYARKSDAARARDAIEARNAAARTQAAMANNDLRGRGFQDALAKLHGKTALTNSMNQTVFNKGSANKNTTKALGSYFGTAADKAISSIGSGGSSDGTSSTNSSGSDTGGFEDGYGEDDEINYGDDD